MKQNIIGAIDIGSNAIRLLITDIDKESNSDDFKEVAFLRAPIRLGEDVFTTGRIGPKKKKQMIEAFHAFSHLFKVYEVKEFRACATSAMREAVNGENIIKDIKSLCGIDIDIISGHEEAELICQAGGLEIIGKRYRDFLYIDVGGGSTEVVVYSKGRKVSLCSFRLGTVRLLTKGAEENEIQRFRNWLSNVKEYYSPKGVIASGGNINKIHKMFNKRAKDCVTSSELKELYSSLKDMDYEERIRLYKLKTYRADVIVPALKIFLWVAKYTSINEFYVPEVGLADGIIHNIYKKLSES